MEKNTVSRREIWMPTQSSQDTFRIYASQPVYHVLICPPTCVPCFNSVRVLVDAYGQVKALVGAFSVIVNTDGSFAALVSVISFTILED